MLAGCLPYGSALVISGGLKKPCHDGFPRAVTSTTPSLAGVVQPRRGNTLQCYAGDAKLHFAVNRQIAFGETHKLVGSLPALGGWDVPSAPDMHWKDGNVWTLDLNLPAGTEFDFKCVKLAGDDVDWEGCDNHHLQVPEAQSVDVEFEWSNGESLHIAPQGSATGKSHDAQIAEASSDSEGKDIVRDSTPTHVNGNGAVEVAVARSDSNCNDTASDSTPTPVNGVVDVEELSLVTYG